MRTARSRPLRGLFIGPRPRSSEVPRQVFVDPCCRMLVTRVVDSLRKLERLVIARSPQGDAAISSRLLRSARNGSIEIHGELLTQDTRYYDTTAESFPTSR